MKKIQINEIPQDIKFEGYYWYSDATSPIFEISIIDLAWFSTMPFIIEANFYNKEKGISISVKNINGEYYIYQYDLKGIEPHQLSHQDYLMRSFKGNELKKVQMVTFWAKDSSDSLINNMTTLIPEWNAFKGFKN